MISGKKFLIRAIVILITFYLFTPLAIVQFISVFFLFIIAGSRLYAEYLFRNIKVSRMDSELRVFRHEWVRVEIKVENCGLLPAFMLVVSDSPGNLQVVRMKKTFCTLFRHSWTLLYWDGLCSERGFFSAGPAVIRGADPLGLFQFVLTDREITKLFVYPSVRSIKIKNNKGIPLGNMISFNPLFEDITRYRSLRPYYPGDERRRINWKASAHVSGSAQTHSNSLLVNEYEATASYPLMIFLNAEQNEYPVKNRRELIERTIEAAAALCLKASRERQALGIIIYTSFMENGVSVIAPSDFTLVPILERLAALDWTNQKNIGSTDHDYAKKSVITMLNHGRHLQYGTRYLYAGPDIGDEAYITLNLLKKHHLSLEYLIIDERKLPSVVPGNSPRYQMKESGYEII